MEENFNGNQTTPNTGTITPGGITPAGINLNDNQHEKNILILVYVSIALSIIGIGLGIFGVVRANQALSSIEEEYMLDEDEDEDEDAEVEDTFYFIDDYTFGKPTNASSIETVYIDYDDGNRYYTVNNDNTAESGSYEDDEEEEKIMVESSQIFQTIFDNYLNYLGDNTSSGEETWSIGISSKDGDSYIGGTGTAPEWFNQLLSDLEIDT